MKRKNGKKIWIDLDNSPHVVFFKPVIRELESRGYDVVLTARECFQVCELAERFKMDYRKIGRHYGKHKVFKVFGLVVRSLSLMPFALREKPVLALSHGSRAQIVAAKALKIPTVLIFDYEHSKGLFVTRPTWSISPDVIPEKALRKNGSRALKYPGIKEEVYLSDFTPSKGLRRELNIGEDEILATVRPPAMDANYQNPESISLFEAAVDHLASVENLRMVVLPRNHKDRALIFRKWRPLIDSRRLIIPGGVLDGLDLIWHSDMVISGGGTMNREAAALGAPVYSVFRGRTGAVDRSLADSGRLVLIENASELKSKIKIAKWKRPWRPPKARNQALKVLADNIEAIVKTL
ncbi:MAG: DUF354 domain-containing protein [Deltaproteobacteria bacterium]|nr:DUF354 domain-containing protein [Deltaproteobacteria bacterium]